jgi:F-type H+-transporting ATPase subunit epsilon
MRFELLTLTGVKFRGEVAEVSLKTAAGQIAVLPGHEPLTTVAVAGPVALRDLMGKLTYFAAFGGLLEVTSDLVRLLADEAEPGEDLIESEVKAALERAEAMKIKAKTVYDVRKSRELAGRHAVRLEVARLQRRHHSR